MGCMKHCAILLLIFSAWAVTAAEPVATVVDNDVLRLRLDRIAAGSIGQLSRATPTNAVIGRVLDLRFAGGDETAVGAADDYFAGRKSPLVILVNGQTRGAAAMLAERLRAAGAGLVIGSTNVADGLHPDITVEVSAADEKKFLENPYAVTTAGEPPALSVTNALLPFVDHMSEAELVREKIKDGDEDDDVPAVRPEASVQVIRDPEMARAVDLLKALAILRTARG
jgi:hypothetical protein